MLSGLAKILRLICTSAPSDYDSQSVGIQSGVITEESGVWTKESHSVWDQEW